MRLFSLATLGLVSVLAVSGCDRPKNPGMDKKADAVNVIDATNLNDIMLTVADPNEAAAYFQRALRQSPDRIDFKRDLAKSLVRAGRAAEAVLIYAKLVKLPKATNEDRVDYAGALIRTNNWKLAEKELDKVPPTYETYKRYQLAAMIADSHKNWKRADSFYGTAAGMATKPAGILNNWGYSKLSRGDYAGAEKLFLEALTYNSNMFTAMNNLAIARAAQQKFTLPAIRMTQIEKAKLLYTMAISAIKQGDLSVARGLLQEAIDTDPQHFDSAVRTLAELENNAKL